MTYSLDTNIIIRLLRNEAAVNASFDKAVGRKEAVAISPFVDYEMRRGFYYCPAQAKEQLYLSLCKRYPVGEMTPAIWKRGASIYAGLRRRGFTVKDADILIAAFCIVNGYTLVTANTKDFENIDGLRLINWAEGQV